MIGQFKTVYIFSKLFNLSSLKIIFLNLVKSSNKKYLQSTVTATIINIIIIILKRCVG